LRADPLFSDDIFLATPADSPFAQRSEVDLADVRDETFITLTQGFATHQDGNRVFKQAGFEPKVAMQVNDIFTLLSMVSSGWAMRCCRGGLRRCTRTG
jgi:LysR family malonate utilization transcriptional regulator